MISIKKKSITSRYGRNTQNIEDSSKIIGIMDLVWNSKIGNIVDSTNIFSQQKQNLFPTLEIGIKCFKVFHDKNGNIEKYKINDIYKKPLITVNKNKSTQKYNLRQKVNTKKYTGSKSLHRKSTDKKLIKKHLDKYNLSNKKTRNIAKNY